MDITTQLKMIIGAATNTETAFMENTSVRFSGGKVFIGTKIRLHFILEKYHQSGLISCKYN